MIWGRWIAMWITVIGIQNQILYSRHACCSVFIGFLERFFLWCLAGALGGKGCLEGFLEGASRRCLGAEACLSRENCGCVSLWKRGAGICPKARNHHLCDSNETGKRFVPLSAKRPKSDQKVIFWSTKQRMVSVQLLPAPPPPNKKKTKKKDFSS